MVDEVLADGSVYGVSGPGKLLYYFKKYSLFFCFCIILRNTDSGPSYWSQWSFDLDKQLQPNRMVGLIY